MPGVLWDEDSAADELVIARNVAAVLRDIVDVARTRPPPALTLAHAWHRAIYQGVSSVPGTSYLGQPRGGADPDLRDYEVVLADRATGQVVAAGVSAALVHRALEEFESALRTAIDRMDAVVAPGRVPADRHALLAVVELAALAHGEWVRIHPYANGNGRTARTWSNWVATRYGLPPFVRIKPRPDGLLYAQAAHASMGLPPDFTADHALPVSLFLDLLRQRP